MEKTIRASPALMQPIASDDVAAAVVDFAIGAPVNGTVEVGGPERLPLDEIIRRALSAHKDTRTVTTDPDAGYFGAKLDDKALTTADNARLGAIRFDDWLRTSLQK